MDRKRTEEVPRYYERLPLGAGPRVVMWSCTAVLVVAGLLLAATAPHRSVLEVVAGVLLTVAGVAVVVTWRVGRFETVVTRTTLRAGFGPFARAYPAWGIRSAAPRPVTGWRRHYAPEEVVVQLEAGSGRATVVVPTKEPADLAEALKRD